MSGPTTELYGRVVAAMAEHHLPLPAHITIRYVELRGDMCAFIVLPDDDIHGANAWITALGIPPAQEDHDFETFVAYGTATVGGDPSPLLGCYAHVTTFLPADSELDRTQDGRVADLVLAGAGQWSTSE
jgi:hypothetical protein